MRRLLVLVMAVLAAAPLVAQTEQQQQRMSESVSVGYVMIPFTPLSAKGSAVTDLRSSEVELFVDGQPVRSDMFEKSENAPVSFTILLDSSGSMALAGKMDAARAAIGALLAHRRPGDDFALYVFAETVSREVVPFTEDPAKITRALADVKPYGKTAFFDALSTMPERSRLGKNPSRAIILLSDGIDNASTLTRGELAHLLQGVSVPIYPLGIRDPYEAPKGQSPEALTDLDLLREVAALTGGKMMLGNQPQQTALAVASLEKDLRAQYLIGFAPTGHGAVKYREISLKLAGRIRSVRVRAGYLGTEPPLIASKRTERKRS
ncbi:MAG TPA: VWA domain-containing protein [Thermoanaerobaculia bacterium]|nr:VWA domain-containing protein [Thermoanaerobaculia bacterium]